MSIYQWWSQDAYQYADTMEPAGLAWEFLRRNPDYRTTYDTASAQADHGTDGPARRWGLRFPGRSKQTRR